MFSVPPHSMQSVLRRTSGAVGPRRGWGDRVTESGESRPSSSSHVRWSKAVSTTETNSERRSRLPEEDLRKEQEKAEDPPAAPRPPPVQVERPSGTDASHETVSPSQDTITPKSAQRKMSAQL